MIPEVCLLQFMAINLEKIFAGAWSVRFHVFSFARACCLWKLIIPYLEKCASSVNKRCKCRITNTFSKKRLVKCSLWYVISWQKSLQSFELVGVEKLYGRLLQHCVLWISLMWLFLCLSLELQS